MRVDPRAQIAALRATPWPASEMRAWMDRHGLTHTRAAQAIGISRRMLGYYLSGDRPIPWLIRLAVIGWDRDAPSALRRVS